MGCGGSKQSAQKTTPPKEEKKEKKEKKETGGGIMGELNKLSDRDTVKIMLTIVSASGIVASDEGGTSDPYCTFRWRGLDYKTSIEYRTLTPEWGTQVALLYNPKSDDKKLTINLLDYDKTLWDELSGEDSAPDALGHADIDFTPALDNPDLTEHEVSLTLKGQRATGTLLVKFLGIPVIPGTTAPPPPPPTKAPPIIPPPPTTHTPPTSEKVDCIEITAVDAKGLRGADTLGKSDPIFSVRWRGKDYETTHMKKTCDPVWKQKIQLPYDAARDREIEIFIWDYDFGNKNDFLGNCTLDINGLLADQIYSVETKLEGEKATGTVSIKVETYEKKPSWSSNPVHKFIKLK